MPEEKSNYEVCLESLTQGEMPPTLAWQKAGDAARQYFILMALMGKIGRKKGRTKKS